MINFSVCQKTNLRKIWKISNNDKKSVFLLIFFFKVKSLKMNKISAAITAIGAYVPDYILSNQLLESMVDTNDEWITTRTGIKERRI